jgi:peptidoglycan/LPS O-acetylase OafA/YrhL
MSVHPAVPDVHAAEPHVGATEPSVRLPEGTIPPRVEPGLLTPTEPRPCASAEQRRLPWVEALKGLALLWIVANHGVERIFGNEYIGNPSPTWPPLPERLAQIAPLHGYGLWDWPLNALRYIGWTGDQGVGLFLLLSGFGLTWGLLARQGLRPLDLFDFYRRRAGRIYPLWIGAHVAFALAWLLTGWGIDPTHKAMYLSMLGIRFTPGLFYFFTPAWWFIGLLIQLYLVFPLLWRALARFSALRLFLVSIAVAVVARLAGLLFLHDYMDAWERGAFFVTRLPEFVAGMSLAAYFNANREGADRFLRAPRTVFAAVAIYALGLGASLSLLGNAIAPLLLTTGAFALGYAALAGVARLTALRWAGEHSYSLYLVHQPMIVLFVASGAAVGALRTWLDVVAALGASVVVALLLENSAGGARKLVGSWWQSVGPLGTAARVAGTLAAIAAVFAVMELTVERFWPQEVYGWGERTSLQPDPAFGWRLVPSSTTRLRWMSYDYVVSASELGFPMPSYAPQRSGDVSRIMTIGDAFTSAEGVDTARSWPRLLETALNQPDNPHRAQVLNFAVTGYGPAQFAAVLDRYVPAYRPDLVLIGFFVKDYGDVLRSDDQFRAAIGFDLPPLPAWKRVLLMYHTRRLLAINLFEPLGELVNGTPRAQGYALGNFAFFERSRTDIEQTGPGLVEQRLAHIARLDAKYGARTAIAMIPASIQVCDRRDLPYYPAVLDTRDGARFDMNWPQRQTRAIAARLGIAFIDLGPMLRALRTCPYQRSNMHWTAAGQAAVAAFLSTRVTALLPPARSHRKENS